MRRIDHKPLQTFFRLNLIAGLLVLTAVLLPGGLGEALGTLDALPAEGAQLRVALAALLYSLFAGYAELYFRPAPVRKM